MLFGKGNKYARRLKLGELNEIRLRYLGGETQGALARDFGVSVGTIGRAVRGETWREHTLLEVTEGAKEVRQERAPAPGNTLAASEERMRVFAEKLARGQAGGGKDD